MKELTFVADRLEEMQKEIGVSNYIGFLEESARKVKRFTDDDTFYVNVYLHSAASVASRNWVSKLAAPGFNIRVFDENTTYIRVFKEVFSSLAVIVFDETLSNAAAFRERIKTEAATYSLVILVNFCGEELCRNFTKELGYGIKTMVADSTACADKNIADLLSILLPGGQDALLKRMAYLNSIRPLLPVLDDIFVAENKMLQTRKWLNTQSTQITRKEEQGLNMSDFASQLRQILQKFSQDTDKGLKLKYEELNKPNTGQFSKAGIAQAGNLQDFNRESMAEKSEKLAVTIPPAFLDDLIKNNSNMLNREFSKDQEFIDSSLDDLLAKVNAYLRQKSIPALKKEEIDIPLPDKHTTVSSYCYIGRQYQGEIIKKGPTEYFVALRDYIGVIMVATGLLAPLNMIASLQDEHSWLRKMNVGIKYTTALITITLIVYGVFDLRTRIPRKREEEFNKELTKAREFIVQESRRMFSESTRDWMTGISNWIRDIAQQINNQIEKKLKEMQSLKGQQLNQEKQQQQRLQQSIDIMQRNIQSAERIKDQLSAKFRELVTNTEKELKY